MSNLSRLWFATSEFSIKIHLLKLLCATFELMGIEKRQQDRVSVSLDIVLDFSSGSREARISDISMGGCFIDSIANVVENEILSFKLSYSSGQSANFFGKVAYIYPGVGFGLRFFRLTEIEKSVLKQIILEHGGKITEDSVSTVQEEPSGDKETVRQEVVADAQKISFEDIMQSIQESLENDNKK